MVRRVGWFFVCLVVGIAIGCSGKSIPAAPSGQATGGSDGAGGTSGAGGGTPDASIFCLPGQGIACIGLGACQGGQACRPDGRGYGACVCSFVGGGGSAGSGGGLPDGAGPRDVSVPASPYPTTMPQGGDAFGPTFDPGGKPALDGANLIAAPPTLIYPITHSLIPKNLSPIEIQAKRNSAGQTVGRVTFHAGKGTDIFDLRLYDTCKDAELDPSVCVIPVDAAACSLIAQASQNADATTPFTITVRLAAPDGENAAETTFDDVHWTYAELTGGIYYWSAPSEIRRYDFESGNATPEVYWQADIDSPGVIYPMDYLNPKNGSTWTEDHSCMGCHAISPDGTKIALAFGGSLPGALGLYNVADKKPIFATWAKGYPLDGGGALQKLDGTTPFALFTAFNPAGTRMINSQRTQLFMRNVDAMASTVGEIFPDLKEPKTHPFWSPKGDKIVFTTYVPDGTRNAGNGDPTAGTTGDITPQGEIWIADADGTDITGPPKVLVAREGTNASNFYPAISSDGKFVVFNKTVCGNSMGAVANSGWTKSTCDGNDDPGAGLWLTTVDGAKPVFLANASGQAGFGNQPLSDSWPRFGLDPGVFGDDTIAWIAFSSRRGYGARTPELNEASAVKLQLWLAAVKITSTQTTLDPSFAPVWFPGQDADMANPSDNIMPVWVRTIAR
jgi:hypothetical protein